LFELTRAEGEISGRDFVTKAFSYLRYAKRDFCAGGSLDVIEIDENALRGFGA